MASPQKEDGFIPIANEIAEAFMRLNLSPQEVRVLWVILRKTYGFNKKEDCISLSQFSQMTGIDRRHVHRALKKLSSKQVIVVTQIGDRKSARYCFQKNFDLWEIKSVTQTGDSCSQTGDRKSATCQNNKEKLNSEKRKNEGVFPKQVTDLSPKQVPTKDNTKDNKQGGVPYPQIIGLYHDKLPQLPQVKILSEKRKRQIKARWFQTEKTQSLEWWSEFFDYVKGCAFLLGDNNRSWRADLEWLTRQENFAKIIEGKYN